MLRTATRKKLSQVTTYLEFRVDSWVRGQLGEITAVIACMKKAVTGHNGS